jgi:hypothetical protein
VKILPGAREIALILHRETGVGEKEKSADLSALVVGIVILTIEDRIWANNG